VGGSDRCWIHFSLIEKHFEHTRETISVQLPVNTPTNSSAILVSHETFRIFTKIKFGFLFCFVCLTVLGIEFCLTLASTLCYHISHSASPFCVSYFGDRVSFRVWANMDHRLPICIPLHIWDARNTPLSHCTQPKFCCCFGLVWFGLVGFGNTGDLIQDLTLGRQVLTTWATLPTHKNRILILKRELLHKSKQKSPNKSVH
jgi:hypothetical protein